MGSSGQHTQHTQHTATVSTGTYLTLAVVGASGTRVADLVGAMRVHGA
jgi:hypothetical protein